MVPPGGRCPTLPKTPAAPVSLADSCWPLLGALSGGCESRLVVRGKQTNRSYRRTSTVTLFPTLGRRGRVCTPGVLREFCGKLGRINGSEFPHRQPTSCYPDACIDCGNFVEILPG